MNSLFNHSFPLASSLNKFMQQNHPSTRAISSFPTPKKVRFFETVKVILIPKREELQAAQLSQFLWLTTADYQASKKEAITELDDYLKDNPGMTYQEAAQMLYRA